ncbi:MAG: Flp family type IVb pilin [Acidobacteria bacterium]|nr:Flp family type IVb pilin [Acidobacteriota bacterium]
MELIKKFWKEEDGQDLIEYALLAGAIALFTIAAVRAVGTSLDTTYDKINTNVSNLPPA